MQKRHAIAALLGLSMIGFNAHAHGAPKPQHGGVVQVAADLGFDLVGRGAQAQIFVDDHGKPFNVSQMTGQLTVLQGATRTQAPLSPAGPNMLQANVQLAAGARAVATLNRPNQPAITVRFVLP